MADKSFKPLKIRKVQVFGKSIQKSKLPALRY